MIKANIKPFYHKSKTLKAITTFYRHNLCKTCDYFSDRTVSLLVTTQQKYIERPSGLYCPLPLKAITRLNGMLAVYLCHFPKFMSFVISGSHFSFPSPAQVLQSSL